MDNKKSVLCIDSATEHCSAALLHDGKQYSKHAQSVRNHTEQILPMVDDLLTQAKITIKDLDFIAFGRGPGSFTGVRVSASIAQGLCFGANVKALPISNLALLAIEAVKKHQVFEIITMIDARMSEVYFCKYRFENNRLIELCQEQVCSPQKAIEQFDLEDGKTYVIAGTGFDAYDEFKALTLDNNVIISDVKVPNALYMLDFLDSGNLIDAIEIEPVYLRNEVTWKKLPGK